MQDDWQNRYWTEINNTNDPRQQYFSIYVGQKQEKKLRAKDDDCYRMGKLQI